MRLTNPVKKSKSVDIVFSIKVKYLKYFLKAHFNKVNSQIKKRLYCNSIPDKR